MTPPICVDPRPASAVERLNTALDCVDTALTCLDLTSVPWVPVEAERWERARRLLHESRAELEKARAAWTPLNGRS